MFAHINPMLIEHCENNYGIPIATRYTKEFGLPIMEYGDYFLHINELDLSPLKWMWNWAMGLVKSSEFLQIEDDEIWKFVIYKIPRLQIIRTISDDMYYDSPLRETSYWKSNAVVQSAIEFGKKYLSLYPIYMDCHAGNWGRYNGKLYLFDPFYVKY